MQVMHTGKNYKNNSGLKIKNKKNGGYVRKLILYFEPGRKAQDGRKRQDQIN